MMEASTSTDTSQLSIFSIPGKPFVKADVKEEHKNMILDAGITNAEEIHKLEFVNWFNQRIIQLYNKGQVNKKMVSLARGERRAIYYSSYNVNGFRFHTIFLDEIRKTQNNRIVVREDNQTDVSYYGRIKDIVELCYTEENKIVLFDCEWYDTTQEGRCYKRDHYGIITVNIALLVTEIKPRNLYEMPVDGGSYQEEIQSISISNENEDDQIQLSRFELDAIIVE
ncbi:hypothetical protein JRO89_XS07G0214300 [Xanthoceras sorbifolium]|uniref:DUF4216 domain-containing protein n=1 Tax=Xanthoceras sorbifolium TaxID=99658 RepID=A0ABQ8HUJ5_9ROSI|nr:hypothetical protein JRO89_XS07G0214300 [Xanthoceras sorbifolium]